SDGIVDAADYVVWRAWYNTYAAWTIPASGLASRMAVRDSTTAPRVMNVTIAGSNSAHDPYSFASHVGSGDQLRTIPVWGANTIEITFSDDVNVDASYL